MRSDTSGWYQKYLLALCQGNREDPQGVNFELAQEDASKLYEAGEKRMGTSQNFVATCGGEGLTLICRRAGLH